MLKINKINKSRPIEYIKPYTMCVRERIIWRLGNNKAAANSVYIKLYRLEVKQ